MAVGEGGPLGLPLGGPQHRWKVETGVDAGRREHRRMPGKDGPEPVAKRQGGVAVPALARQQMQKPETTGEKADPLKVGPAIPNVIVVPAVSAGHVAEAWHAAMERHVLANHVGAVAELANGPLERPFVVHVYFQTTMPMARSRSARPS